MLQTLKNIINPDVVIPIETNSNYLKIKEKGKDSKIDELTINGIPENTFAFTLDYQPKKNSQFFQQLSCYLNKSNGEGINKGCDLVIISCDNNQYKAVIFDLKSNRISPKKIKKQLLNSELYLKYLISMIDKHYSKNIPLKYIYSVATTSTSGVQRNPTYRPNRDNDDKINYIVIPHNKVIGKKTTLNYNQLKI